MTLATLLLLQPLLLWSVTATEPLTLIADNATTIPGTSIPFEFFSAPLAAGTLISFSGSGGKDRPGGVYMADMAAAGSSLDNVVPRPKVTPVFSLGDSFPGGGHINQTSDVSLCSDGTAAFFAESEPAKCTPGWACSGALLVSYLTDDSLASPRHLEIVVSIGSPAPDGDGDLVAFERCTGPTAAGTAASGLHLVFRGLTNNGVKALYRASKAGNQWDEYPTAGWALTRLLSNGTAMPPPDGNMSFVDIGTGIGAPISPSGDHVVFFGSNRKGIMNPNHRDGVYLWTEKAGVEYVASSNHTAVPGKADFHFIGFGSISLAVNKAGEAVICFLAEAWDEKSPPLIGIWCQLRGALTFIVGSTNVIPDSPEPSPHNKFQYVDYPAVSIGEDGFSYMVVFQGNDGLGRRGVYRASAPERLETLTDWQDPMRKVINIQLNTPSSTGETVAIWLGFDNGNEGIFATAVNKQTSSMIK